MPHNYDVVVSQQKRNFSQEVYRYIADDAIILHNKYMKWRNELGEEFCEGLTDFSTMHLQLYSVTNVPKYRSFQYRLLQRALVMNTHLYKWKIRGDELCSFCNEEREVSEHLFFLLSSGNGVLAGSKKVSTRPIQGFLPKI